MNSEYVNYEVERLINKNLKFLKLELSVEIKFKEEISNIYTNSVDKIREDLNKLRNVLLENKNLSNDEKENIHECIFDSYFKFNNSALELFESAIERIK